MSIVHIRATFECDGCGSYFRVEMDPADKLPDGWDLLKEAEDCLRGGLGVDGGLPAIVHDMHLCGTCERVAAQVGPDEGGYAPKAQIKAAIAKHYDAVTATEEP